MCVLRFVGIITFVKVMLELHFYLWVSALVAFIGFVLYSFVQEHKIKIKGRQMWKEAYSKFGVDRTKMSHDDGMWYYDGQSTCVGYGTLTEKCPRSECYCAGNKTFGSVEQQSSAVATAIKNGGVHPLCPVVYEGAS